jgi:hypothetical protein
MTPHRTSSAPNLLKLWGKTYNNLHTKLLSHFAMGRYKRGNSKQQGKMLTTKEKG